MSLIYNQAGSMAGSANDNYAPHVFDRNVTRTPESVISIFTVNTRDQYSTSGQRVFPGRKPNERYAKVGQLNDPMFFSDIEAIDEKRAKRIVTSESGEWVAMDWLNPDNTVSLDQNFVVPNLVDRSNDLLSRGVFYIKRPYNPAGNTHDKPTEAEVAGAEARLKNRYNQLVQRYNTYVATKPGSLSEIQNDELVDALNAFGIATPLNSTLQMKVPCQTCGEMKPANAQFHRSDALGGRICIEPTATAWKAAVLANVVDADKVPDDFKEKRGPGRPPNS